MSIKLKTENIHVFKLEIHIWNNNDHLCALYTNFWKSRKIHVFPFFNIMAWHGMALNSLIEMLYLSLDYRVAQCFFFWWKAQTLILFYRWKRPKTIFTNRASIFKLRFNTIFVVIIIICSHFPLCFAFKREISLLLVEQWTTADIGANE